MRTQPRHDSSRARAQLRILALWAPLLALLVCVGCKSKGAAPSHATAPAGAAGYRGDGGGVIGGEADDVAMEESVAAADYGPAGGRLRSRSRTESKSLVKTRNSFRNNDDAERELSEASGEAAPEPEPADPTTEPISVEGPGQSGQTKPKPAPTAAKKRQVLYTATMQVSVFDVEKSMREVEALPERYGGWLHQRLDNEVVLRIPAEHLEEVMDLIAELGVVEQRLLQAFDVTAEYTDLESRIRILSEMQAHLEQLLAQAKDVEQALEIRQALDRVTMELELAQARMRELARSIAFSTLILRLIERGPATDTPTSNDPFPWVDQLGVEATEYR